MTDRLAAETALAGLPGVSRETLRLLDAYARELEAWQARINLVSPGTLPMLWERHILDCAQLARLAAPGSIGVDLGSGGGLPGLVLACLFKGADDGSFIHLVESNRKKAAFLQHVTGLLKLPARVHAERAEIACARLSGVQIVTARALAPLEALIGLGKELLTSGAVGLFPKGREVMNELTEAEKSWHFTYELLESITDPAARIIRVTLPARG